MRILEANKQSIILILFFILSLTMGLNTNSFGANHRESPISAIDDEADIPDVFAFVSYDPNDPKESDKVTLIVTYDPFLEPGNGFTCGVPISFVVSR